MGLWLNPLCWFRGHRRIQTIGVQNIVLQVRTVKCSRLFCLYKKQTEEYRQKEEPPEEDNVSLRLSGIYSLRTTEFLKIRCKHCGTPLQKTESGNVICGQLNCPGPGYTSTLYENKKGRTEGKAGGNECQ